MAKEQRPTNFAVAVYLAQKYRDRLKSDDDFKKVAALYNMKWQVLKRNFEAVCEINEVFEEE